MKMGMKKIVEVDAKTIQIHAKVCDSGTYTLLDAQGEEIGERDQDYVPDFFPGDNCGDYLIFNIDIETGRITNWEVPTAKELREAFKAGEDDDE